MISHSQKAIGLVWGLSTRKIRDPVADPVVEDLLARVPQRHPVGVRRRPEVDRVDVLVLLRRVLGVGDGAVGPVVEPFGMLAHPGMIGRALQGVVEGDLHAVGPDLGRPDRRSPRWSRAPGRWRCARPRRSRWPTGCPGRRSGAVRVLLRPFPGRACRWGGSAAGTARRSPWRASSGTRRGRPLQAAVATGETARTRRRPGPARGRPTASCGHRGGEVGGALGPRRAAATSGARAGPHPAPQAADVASVRASRAGSDGGIVGGRRSQQLAPLRRSRRRWPGRRRA